MEPLLSTALAQQSLFDRVGTAVARKGLDNQQVEGQNALKLIESAAQAFTPAHLGQKIDVRA